MGCSGPLNDENNKWDADVVAWWPAEEMRPGHWLLVHYANAGKDPELPKEKELMSAGVHTFEAAASELQGKSATEQINTLLSKLSGSEGNDEATLHSLLVPVGAGLPAMPKRLVGKILAGD